MLDGTNNIYRERERNVIQNKGSSMLRQSLTFSNAYEIDEEVYLLGFDSTEAAQNLTEEGKHQAQTLFNMFQKGDDGATEAFIDSLIYLDPDVNDHENLKTCVEAYIAAYVIRDGIALIRWFPMLQLLDRVQSYHEGEFGWEARTHMDIDNQRFHLRCI
ncbi:hypothetical protein [Paenibacillus sp. 32352]|uniref:hypothetical protein n=1 Tax=Paenibacillus sp. 32352 TaxID=1969111 RepID=UPI0009AF1671|nr:hypothetical protein [Paenibacillus sp. 32352]